MNLYEKYRPTDFEHVLGQDKAIRQIQAAGKSGYGGRAFWISGPSGTGKTTLARIIAGLGADNFTTQEYDSGDTMTAAQLDEIARTMYLWGWLGKGRAFIVNEAHGLSRMAVRRFLGILESIPSHVVFIFTTTTEGQLGLFDQGVDASPFLSRCHEIYLTNQGLCKAFANHVKTIAETEGLDGKPLAAYETLAKDSHNNCRRMLQAVADGMMMTP